MFSVQEERCALERAEPSPGVQVRAAVFGVQEKRCTWSARVSRAKPSPGVQVRAAVFMGQGETETESGTKDA